MFSKIGGYDSIPFYIGGYVGSFYFLDFGIPDFLNLYFPFFYNVSSTGSLNSKFILYELGGNLVFIFYTGINSPL